MLEIRGVCKQYRRGGLFSSARQTILDHVDLTIHDRECMGLLGESGSGKSTLARQVLGIEQPDEGEILFDGLPVRKRSTRSGRISAVFQDYSSSINPYYTVEKAIMENIPKGQRDASERIDELLKQVGLDRSYRKRHPHELSGGETQRICIARALAASPLFLVLDEAISSLDASVQYQILQLLKELKNSLHLSYLFVTHDIQAAVYLCDRIAIFNNGTVVEIVSAEDICHVKNAYSRKLLESVVTF